MSIIDANSFCSQDPLGMDLWVLLLGTNLILDADVPSDSQAIFSITNTSVNSPSNFWRHWLLPTGTTLEPSGTRVRIHSRWQNTASSVASNMRCGTARNGIEQISFSVTNTSLFYTIRVNGSVVFTSANAAPVSSWNRIILDIDQQTGGLVRVLDSDASTVLASYILTGPDITGLDGKPNGFFLGVSSNTQNFADLIAQDPLDSVGSVSANDLVYATVLAVSPTGDSATDTDGTGTFATVDEIPADDSDGVVFTSTALRKGFTMPALVSAPLAVIPTFRMVRTGSTAGVNHQHTLRDAGGVLDGGIIPTPGSGFTRRVFNLDRSGNTWTTAAYDLTEIGCLTVA